MRAITALFLALLACCAMAQPENAQLRRELQQVYTTWCKTFKANNVKGLLAMLDPSFVSVDENGKRTSYGDFKKMASTMGGQMKAVDCSFKIDHVRDHGEEAVAWVTMTESMKIKQNGKWVPMSHTIKFAETLKRTPGGWKFVYSQVLPEG